MCESTPLVSIIVPIYGTEEYLPVCIDSIRKQTYQNLQIILVDDQSPDKCPEICDAYAKKDSRIIVIHQENKGVSGARNAGLNHASGEYIMFVDSDDELYTNAVATLLQDACEYNADVVSAVAKTVNEYGVVVDNPEKGDYQIYQGDKPLLLLLDEDPSTYVVWAKIFRTSFIKGVGFEEGKNLCEDSFFLFQCYVKKPLLVQHNVAIYKQNIRLGSSSRLKFSDKTLSVLHFFEKKKAYVTENFPQYSENLYQAEVCVNLRLLDMLCSTNDKKYKPLQKRCIKKVRALRAFYRPVNLHHKRLLRIVSCGLYGVYRRFVRIKYYR